MPKLSRWFIKTGMLCLLAGLLAGIILALPVHKDSYIAGLYPEFIHLMTFGWITQMIYGVAYWMFPRNTKEKPRGSEFFGWSVYLFLNIGLLLRVYFEPFVDSGDINPWLIIGVVAAAVLQWLAGVIFVINTWNRVSARRR